MTKKNRYRSVSVNDKRVAMLLEGLQGGDVIVGIDIAKTRQFAAFEQEGKVHGIVRWEHPRESRQFLKLLSQLKTGGDVVVALEPSSTYGDALRHAFMKAGLDVRRVSPNRTHKAAEVYDGVPSYHDAKSAAIICKMHRDGISEPWPMASEYQRGLTAALRIMTIYQKQFRDNRNRLESLTARHWPELPRVLELGSVTLLELLIEYGSAEFLARDPEKARAFMRRKGRAMLKQKKIDAVISDASDSFGLPPTRDEILMIQELARETRRCQKAMNQAKKQVEAMTDENGPANELRPVIGKTTAAILIAAAGDPKDYGSASAYQKALGLNLKEKSSGTSRGGLHITKRGSGVARHYLFLAALRLLQRDPVVRAWYLKKVARSGGSMKLKAVIAIMRKLVRALWHVAHGCIFDSHKLYDTSRLQLEPMPTTMEAS